MNRARLDWYGDWYGEMTSRNTGFLSPHEQERLRGGGVFVCGVGGMGSIAAHALVRAGLGRIAIADPDTFEASNLNRQLYAVAGNIGAAKTAVTRDALNAINPALVVEDAGPRWLDVLPDLLRRYPVVVNAMDDTRAGIALYRAARTYGATVVDAYSAPLPSVTVVQPGDARPEERLAFPTLGREAAALHDDALAAARRLEAEFVLRHTPALDHFDAAVASEILAGTRPRSSFVTIVMIAGLLMAHEAICLTAGRGTATDATGYFLDPWRGTVYRPGSRP